MLLPPRRPKSRTDVLFSSLTHQMGGVVAIISQMITPAIFILACGNLVVSTMTRVARIVDRVRAAGSTMDDFELNLYSRRSVLVERALVSYYAAIALFVLSSLLIALSIIIPELVLVPTAVTILGAIAVFAGAMNSLLEVRLAAGLVRHEISDIETQRNAKP
jgi:hypothetical protein